jgi:diguanylate cyclase (GGDEF)-like protein
MKTIINPLKKVTNGISEHNISAFEDLLKRNDEIGKLAKATKEYLLQSDKIKQYVNELEVKANELRNANAKIRKLLETDSLTNLLSRHVLVEQFDRLIKQSKENFTPLSVIFMDLDNFKKVNDIHGHLTGDNLLKKIGEIVTSSLRESDFPIRYGGDEIIILLPNTTKENATIIAERIRKRIENELYDKYGVTASIGVTELLPSDDFDSLITRVDNLAYNSKNNKKNKVTSG